MTRSQAKLTIIIAAAAGLAACAASNFENAGADRCMPTTALEGPCATEDAGLSMNDIQAVGSHNSYKLAIPANELAVIAETNPDAAIGLDYSHIPLTDQLDLGLRQIELDVFYDPEGGRYANPALPAQVAGEPGAVPFDGSPMHAPGLKVMHVQDIDQRANCRTLIACLTEIRDWSDAHPDHVPLLIMFNTKDGTISIPDAVVPLPFDRPALDAMDAELLSVFDRARIITPDEVRGDAPTLREGALAGGWPSLAEARGRVLFALDEGPARVEAYTEGRPSLEGAAMFVNSVSEDAPHAAYFTLNNPIGQAERIAAAVEAGLLVRTRADADTREARINDTTRREAAFASGAQYVSTDYYLPREDFGDYQVALSGGGLARCNPVRRDEECAPR